MTAPESRSAWKPIIVTALDPRTDRQKSACIHRTMGARQAGAGGTRPIPIPIPEDETVAPMIKTNVYIFL